MYLDIETQEIMPEISLEGFQVVKADMFQTNYSRTSLTMSIWPDSISFSQSSLNALKKCERIRIEVNVETKSILIIPVTIQDKDSIRWSILHKGKSRRINCSRFTAQLYRAWGWEKELAYKAMGKLVTSNDKVMLMYSFDQASNWKFLRADANG